MATNIHIHRGKAKDAELNEHQRRYLEKQVAEDEKLLKAGEARLKEEQEYVARMRKKIEDAKRQLGR